MINYNYCKGLTVLLLGEKKKKKKNNIMCTGNVYFLGTAQI